MYFWKLLSTVRCITASPPRLPTLTFDKQEKMKEKLVLALKVAQCQLKRPNSHTEAVFLSEWHFSPVSSRSASFQRWRNKWLGVTSSTSMKYIILAHGTVNLCDSKLMLNFEQHESCVCNKSQSICQRGKRAWKNTIYMVSSGLQPYNLSTLFCHMLE